ncbi:MAG TPA: YqgE/AlgH family protein [Acidiferrobacteraceae bacterium]|nr:YqgE/AlgH family protein [Acidiferrobacteraceae bacterium]HEX20269.1 YqgE/AlgH family protein [Acidiferrobacteraceae bacterium]
MNEFQSLSNHFLIAMPTLADPNFHKTVTLVCEHTAEGAMGLTINRPLDLGLHELLEQTDIAVRDLPDLPVFLGGPVQNNRGFVLHAPLGQWETTLTITDKVGVSSSRDILEAIAGKQGPEQYLVALGYAGWGAGQLEHEMAENSWLSTPAKSSIYFDTPIKERWQAAAQSAGVDLNTLSSEAGHA